MSDLRIYLGQNKSDVILFFNRFFAKITEIPENTSRDNQRQDDWNKKKGFF